MLLFGDGLARARETLGLGLLVLMRILGRHKGQLWIGIGTISLLFVWMTVSRTAVSLIVDENDGVFDESIYHMMTSVNIAFTFL